MADVAGTPLWYERRGEGPPLLYSNGSGATLGSAAAILDRFATSFEVVGYDHRGMGRSPLSGEPYSVADLAADVTGLLDHLGWQRCALAGLSFGGMVAQEVAVRAPDRLTRLALMSTSPGGSMGSYPLEQLESLPEQERVEQLLLLADERWNADWFAEHPEDLALVMRLAADRPEEQSEGQRRGHTAQLAARRGHDVLGRLTEVEAPTLVQCGRHDRIAPPANAEAIVARVPDAQLRTYDGGHLFLFQDPTAWPDLLAFLAG